MLKKIPLFLLTLLFLSSTGCTWLYKGTKKTAILLPADDATREQLTNEVNRFAKVNTMRAKMTLQFEDNRSAQKGTKESYIGVNLDVVLQRPSNIYLIVGIFGSDIAQMTSNGQNFRVALLKDNSGGKNKMFLLGTNDADYSKIQNELKENSSSDAKDASTFSNVRPQHLTDALLLRPIEPANLYLQSTIYQTEEDLHKRKVVRGYYLLDEFVKNANGELRIGRRFWFDRVGGIHLVRQQIFDGKAEIESDIVYGKEGNLTTTGEFKNLPLEITVTRPKEKYTMSLKYQNPESVSVGKVYNPEVFDLKNGWGLREVDLDKRLKEINGKQAIINNQ